MKLNKIRRFAGKIVKHPLYSLITGAIAGMIGCILFIWLSSSPIYVSNLTIDEYGANYSSAKWEYQFQPSVIHILIDILFRNLGSHWAYLDMDVRNIENRFNLSDYIGIEFFIKGTQIDQNVMFSLFMNNQTETQFAPYQYNYNFLIDTYWQKKTILFSNVSKATYEANKKAPSLNLEKVFALGFSIHTSTSQKNIIWIDEIYLIDKNETRIPLSSFNDLNTNINGIKGYWHTSWGIPSYFNAF
ncbi:MAG: hypothetical protein ACE14P_02610 [Methanotrichaceae archaeon]